MRTSQRLPRKPTMIVAIVAALAFTAFATASASAAKWVQGETSMRWTASSITVEENGGSPVSCSLEEASSEPIPVFVKMGAVANGYGGVNTSSGPHGYNTELSCDGGQIFEFCACINAGSKISNGVYKMSMTNRFPGAPWMQSPYGEYAQGATTGTFVNGSGGTSSTLTFQKVNMNQIYPPITISGTFTVTDGEGGLLTLKD